MTTKEILLRFWPKLRREDDCWVWTASKYRGGYGAFWNGERVMRAHRWSYEVFVGPIPNGLDLDHLCRNRACVNPAHLEPVTRLENLLRGETAVRRKFDTHCQRGHAFDEANTYLVPTGGRRCKECANARRRKAA